MVDTDFATEITVERGRSYVEWGPVIAGAAAAAAISFILLTFGTAIGLSAASPWPDSGLPWWLLALIAAIWMMVVQAGSYAAGGYLAGRLREPVAGSAAEERTFRDGAHGFLVWALGVVVTALVVSWTAGAALRTGVEATATVGSGIAAGASVGAVNGAASASDLAAYPIDRLLRPGTAATPGASEAPSAEEAPLAAPTPALATGRTGEERASLREEIGRTLTTAVAAGTLPADDRAHLASVVSTETGLPQAEAEQRVDEAFAAVRQATTEAREAVDKARIGAAIAGYLTAAALLVAAAAATAGASLGGRHRDESGTLRVFGVERLW
jgi:hypothetical protein